MGRAAEKREFERIRFEEPVVIDVRNEWTTLGTSGDVSVGGMFIEAVDSAISVPFGTPVTVHVRLSGEILELPGVVRWTKSGGIGVQWSLLGARETHAITETIARHARSGTHKTTDEIEVDVEEDTG